MRNIIKSASRAVQRSMPSNKKGTETQFNIVHRVYKVVAAKWHWINGTNGDGKWEMTI